MSVEQPKIETNSLEQEKLEEKELKQEGEKIYSEEFTDQLDAILNYEFKDENGENFVLKETIDQGLEKISENENNLEEKKKFVGSLVKKISEIPHYSWAINFSESMKTGESNCSNCSSLLGLILEKLQDKAGIKNIEYVFPAGHAANVVTFEDGSVFFADSRNNFFKDSEIGKRITVERRGNLKIYKLNEYDGDYKIVPALPLKEGILAGYLGNLNSAFKTVRGDIPEIKKEIPEEQKEDFIRGAEDICKRMDLTEEKVKHLVKILDVFGSEIREYEESDEFKKELERVCLLQVSKNKIFKMSDLEK